MFLQVELTQIQYDRSFESNHVLLNERQVELASSSAGAVEYADCIFAEG